MPGMSKPLYDLMQSPRAAVWLVRVGSSIM